MDIPWEDIRIFLAIAKAGSLSGAAKALRLGQPTVTRRLAELEDHVGAKLFARSVSGATLTTNGERLLASAEQMARWAAEVSRLASASDALAQGQVRIAAMPFMAARWFAPFATWVRERYPKLALEILSSVRHVDLARGEADLALRMNPPSDGDLITIATFHTCNAVVAAPALVQKLIGRGLHELPWIAWAPPYEDMTPNVQLRAMIPNFTPAFTSDSYLVQLAAAQAGAGVMVVPHFEHSRLPDFGLVPLPIDLGEHAWSSSHLVAAKSALNIHRVRIVAQFLEKELRIASIEPQKNQPL